MGPGAPCFYDFDLFSFSFLPGGVGGRVNARKYTERNSKGGAWRTGMRIRMQRPSPPRGPRIIRFIINVKIINYFITYQSLVVGGWHLFDFDVVEAAVGELPIAHRSRVRSNANVQHSSWTDSSVNYIIMLIVDAD